MAPCIGCATNTASTLLFMAGSSKDLNLRSVFLHFASDAVVSLGAVVAKNMCGVSPESHADPRRPRRLDIRGLGADRSAVPQSVDFRTPSRPVSPVTATT